MSTKTFTFKNYYTRDIPIDDGFEGEAVARGETFKVRIRRFTVAQLQNFQRGFARLNNPTAARMIFRRPAGDEQAMRDIPARLNEKGVVVEPARSEHVVPDDEIKRRRLEEMDAEAMAAYEAANQADDTFMAEFCSEAIADYVSVAPSGVVLKAERDNGEVFQVQTGKDILEAFGGNLSMLVRLTRAIHQENTLSPEAKKVLRPLSGLTASSPMPVAAAAVDGATPAAIVASAEVEGYAPSAGVSADQDPIPSGSAALVGAT